MLFRVEKESGDFKVGEPNDNPVLSAGILLLLKDLIEYTAKQLGAALDGHKALPKFKHPIKIVVAGGDFQS